MFSFETSFLFPPFFLISLLDYNYIILHISYYVNLFFNILNF
nr:MAG TPA: hypothetical protein [Caudoviricetes sp.]